jgi:hypothetical protein
MGAGRRRPTASMSLPLDAACASGRSGIAKAGRN